jgi:LytS/YehU family sensor histidine kinase
MLVQPFVENALKHGLSLKEGIKKLDVAFRLTGNNELLATITDNGIGRLKAQQVKEQQEKLLPHQSKGIKLVQERLGLFRHFTNQKSIHFEDLLDEHGKPTGTKVSIRLPLSFS